MLDQLIIGTTASLDDFGASLAERAISTPIKKEIKETVPFSNQTYDFSKINGELYWEERELTYIFEMFGDDPADLEYKKTAFSNWIMNVMAEEIHDPYEPDFHYVGTYSDMEFEDDESIEKTTVTVSFMAYPYKIANTPTNYVFEIEDEKKVEVLNDSGHRITPIITANIETTIVKDGVSYIFPVGVSSDDIFALDVGKNALKLSIDPNETPLIAEMGEPPGTVFVYSFSLSNLQSGKPILYKTCTPNIDGTYVLSEPYEASYWQWNTKHEALGCWCESGGLPHEVTSVSSTSIIATQRAVNVKQVPAAVQISFVREVF